MGMKALDELREKFCRELDEIARKQELSAGDLETVHKLTDTIKNIDKICIMDEGGGYSQAGDWEARGTFGDYSRDGGNSYAGRRRDSMGRYSRDDGMMRGNSYARGGRYSRGGMMEHIQDMMSEAETEEQREAIKRFRREMESLS